MCGAIREQRSPGSSGAYGIGRAADSAAVEMQRPIAGKAHWGKPAPAIFHRHEGVWTVSVWIVHAGGVPETVRRAGPGGDFGGVCTQETPDVPQGRPEGLSPSSKAKKHGTQAASIYPPGWGKALAGTEFGAKLHISLADGYAGIEILLPTFQFGSNIQILFPAASACGPSKDTGPAPRPWTAGPPRAAPRPGPSPRGPLAGERAPE